MNLDSWSAELQEQLEGLVAGTAGAVVPVSDDERNLSLPGVWFGLAGVHPTLSGSSWHVDWTITVLGTVSAPRDAVRQLGALSGPIAAAFMPEKLEAIAVVAPNLSADPIPALRFTITTECEE